MSTDISEEKLILNELYNEINHHDILAFKLGDKSLNEIFTQIKPLDKKFFHYQRYNFKLEDLSPELSFYNIELKDSKREENNKIKNENKISHKFNELLQDKSSNISEVLENIMEDINVFDVLSQDGQNKNTYNEIKSHNKREKEDLTPLEIINKLETDYNNILIQKIKSETDISELYPLDTYKKNNELRVQLLSEKEKNIQFEEMKKIMQIKEIENKTKEKNIFENFSVLTVDKPFQEPGSIEPRYIYACTNKGRIKKILLNNINSNKNNENNETFDSNGECINCIDIYENYMVTGHQNGSIIFWENDKIFQKNKINEKEENNAIIYLKIIKVHKKKKIEIIYSDNIGGVFFLKISKGFMKYSEKKELILCDNKYPIYKISFFSIDPNLNRAKKKYMIFSLISLKGVKLLKKRPKPYSKNEDSNNKYIIEPILFNINEKEEGIFDSAFGYGFPPMETNLSNSGSIRSSISESIVISKDTPESLILVVSFSDIINLYEITKNKELKVIPIGHYINDRKIIYINFLTNSYIIFISNDFYLKVINTFDFDDSEYKEKHSPTKNSLLIYDEIDLKKIIMIRQTNINKYNEDKNILSNYNIYLNSIVALNKSILILGRVNLYQYTLLQWDSIIQSLDKEKEYEKMLWLAMVVFNNNENLLTINSKNRDKNFFVNYQYQICSPIISKFLIQVVIKEIEKKNFRPLRMMIEFCIGAELYECLYESIFPLSEIGYDSYFYKNLTAYILNDDCTFIEFKPNFLIKYFKYYVDIHEKIILSEILFHINTHILLEDKLILSAIHEFKLLNPLFFIQIKTSIKGKIDYFQPIKYMYDIFHADYIKEKSGTLLNNLSEKTKKEDYYKMIIENDFKYFNEDISIYHEFLAHKILWYCNKCLNKEEFHTNIEISDNNYKIIAKKIIFFLTRKEVMNEFLEFDSFSYFQIISRFYLENDLLKLIKSKIENKEDKFKDIKDFIYEYSKGEINSLFLSEKYFFYEILNAVEQCNNFYIKYDFYLMIILIYKENEEKKEKDEGFSFDKYLVKETIKFFINFFDELEKNKKKDAFNRHKNLKDIKRAKKEVENNLMIMIKLLDKNNQQIIIDDYLEILAVPNIYKYRKIKLYLYELSKQYEEYFNLYKETLEENYINLNIEEDINISRVERIKIFFDWINKILFKTSEEQDNKETHNEFKEFILSNFSYLSDLSLKDLSKLAEFWFKGEEEKIILALKNSQSQALQFKYINYYFLTHECDPDKIKEGDTYYEYLLLKINLLIKAGQKDQILNLLHHNTFLCKNNLANKLLNNKVYDACVFIYYIIDELEKGIILTNEQIIKALEKIDDTINSDDYIPTDIDSLLYNFKKYIELGIGICQKASNKEKIENAKNKEKVEKIVKYLLNRYWIIIINSIYIFQLKFLKKFDENQNNYKTKDYIKINNSLDENFESILSKMTEYIPTKYIVDIMCEKCGSAGFKKFKNLNYLMFSDYRIESLSMGITKGFFKSEIERQLNDFIFQFNKGNNIVLDFCDFCGKSIKYYYLDKIIYFKCNHIFHKICFDKKKCDKNICPICRKKEADLYEYEEEEKKNIACDQLFDIDFKKEENVIVNNIQQNTDKQLEIQKIKLRKKNIAKLKRINRKKKEINYLLNDEILK